jgi:hypothetical protein
MGVDVASEGDTGSPGSNGASPYPELRPVLVLDRIPFLLTDQYLPSGSAPSGHMTGAKHVRVSVLKIGPDLGDHFLC